MPAVSKRQIQVAQRARRRTPRPKDERDDPPPVVRVPGQPPTVALTGGYAPAVPALAQPSTFASGIAANLQRGLLTPAQQAAMAASGGYAAAGRGTGAVYAQALGTPTPQIAGRGGALPQTTATPSTFASGIGAKTPYLQSNPSTPASQAATAPLVRLTEGGISPPTRIGGAALPLVNLGQTPFPAAVQLTAGGLTNVARPSQPILQSADVAIASGNLYVGPTGALGGNQFVVTDLSDVAGIARSIPGANIFYSDPNQPGPLRAVSGPAAYIPALNQYLMGHDLPRGVVDSLVRLGFLEADDGGLFQLPLGGGGGGGGTRTSAGFGGGRGFPSSRDLSLGLIQWRI